MSSPKDPFSEYYQTCGKLGLKNLGNTCYLNSAIQSLSHLPEIINYISSSQFDVDLKNNKELNDNEEEKNKNILYHQFAEAFKNLIFQFWTPQKTQQGNSSSLSEVKYLVPIEFRKALISLFPEFDNNNQQDAHEVLILILDTLSTALNRVKNNGTTILKEIYEDNSLIHPTKSFIFNNSHKAVNDSFIIDTFFGQMKSTIHCFNCNKIINENYDPFSSLELPIPNQYKCLLYFIPIKKNFRPIMLNVMVNDNLQFKDILIKVKEITEYNFKSGTFYWVFDNKLEKIIDEDERCGDLSKRMAFLFLIENSENMKTKFYTELNFKIIEEGEDDPSTNTNITFPRIFPYTLSTNDSTIIYLSIFSELNEYIKSYISNIAHYETQGVTNNSNNNSSSNKEDETLLLNQNYYFTVKSPKIQDKLFKCILCGREDISEFQCDCINSKLTTSTIDFTANSNLREHIEDLNDFYIMSVTINVKSSLLKYKELNRCSDYTQRMRNEIEEINLYNLCDYFFAEEKIVGNYHCDNCGQIKFSLKKQELNCFPKVLILHLKRFSYSIEDRNIINIGKKNDNFIDFKEEIDLGKYNNKGQEGKYKLFSVIYHKGKISSGHYTVICKHFYLGKWMEFDDKTVKVFQNNKSNQNGTNSFLIPKDDGYILFYRKTTN